MIFWELFGLVVAIFALGGWYYSGQLDALLKKYGGQTHFTVGKYLVGLDSCAYPTESVECVVTPDQFVFAKINGRELGRIPRDSIEEVAFDDKSQIAQRLTATRLLALGVFALAAPKKRKINEWCVAIRWVNDTGLRRATVFEYSGSEPEAAANKAASKLIKYVQPMRNVREIPSLAQASIIADSKTCPFCAETIKSAAIVCRFCNHELTQ